MSIFNYGVLTQFKQARFGSNIITFDDLVKERNLQYGNKEYHVWLARKEKKDYLLLNEDTKNLPIRIKKTEIIKDEKAIFNFISQCNQIGFTPKCYFSYHELIDKFCSIEHTNKEHQRLKWNIAVGSLLQRLNIRICGNTELGKDSTFIILNHLTNKVSVFDKPKTLAKLEYGLLNDVLMVNELIPTKEEERYDINDFLLSVGSLNPTYPKKTRSSAGTKETYDMAKFSLVLCYNTLQEIAEKDKVNYFDYAFGQNVLKRFFPVKLNGRIATKQFRNTLNYNGDIDKELLEIARTLEWYRQNWRTEVKNYNFQTPELGERFEIMFGRMAEILSIDAESEQEYLKVLNCLYNSHRDYYKMLSNNQLIKNYNAKPIELNPQDEQLNPEIIDLSQDIKPLDFIRRNGKNNEIDVDVFVKAYTEDTMQKLLRDGDVFLAKPHILKILE